MGQKSTIEKLPAELLTEVNRCLERMTIYELVEHMSQLGVDLSKSAVGRHKKKIDEVSEQLRRSRVIAEAIGKKIEDQPDDKVAALNRELLHDQIFKLVSASEDGEPLQLTSKQVRELSDSLRNLATAGKSETDRVFKVRKEMADQSAKIVDEETKKEPGMSAETVDNIKRRILGLTR